jgi:hypothetical protein
LYFAAGHQVEELEDVKVVNVGEVSPVFVSGDQSSIRIEGERCRGLNAVREVALY